MANRARACSVDFALVAAAFMAYLGLTAAAAV
jgi:hypothetical protein